MPVVVAAELLGRMSEALSAVCDGTPHTAEDAFGFPPYVLPQFCSLRIENCRSPSKFIRKDSIVKLRSDRIRKWPGFFPKIRYWRRRQIDGAVTA